MFFAFFLRVVASGRHLSAPKNKGGKFVFEPGLQIQHTVAENFIMANRALIHAAVIAGVTLDSVGDTVFDLFDDTNMIVLTVLHIELPLLIQSKKIIIHGEASMELSAHCHTLETKNSSNNSEKILLGKTSPLLSRRRIFHLLLPSG